VPCPDEQAIGEFVRGDQSPDERAEIERHLDGCSTCATVVAAYVQLFEDDRRTAPPPSEHASDTALGRVPPPRRVLVPGASVGRYRVLEVVGSGGMGVVYAAYDPELDRKVAVKVLRNADHRAAERTSRLLREAQAMAKLSHPNVITVHDVGTFDDQVFVAMEFVQGRTLSAWLRSDPPWAEIESVFVAAGRGLEAAHRVGIVHRDFKPDNVLIGDDGRVRVTDFGLARLASGWTDHQHATGDSDASRDDDAPALPLTATGALVGTPAYMAPEQFDGGTVSDASDQYSFCVALYEAAYRERPHKASSLPELVTRVLAAEVARPAGEGKAPRHVREAIARGLSRHAEDRFPSMGALLIELTRRPRRPWRSVLLWGLPVAAVTLGLATYDPSAAAPPSCPRDGLAGVWDADTRERVATAFSGIGAAYATEAWTRTAADLDAYAEAWLDLEQQACTARMLDREDPIAALRSVCLQDRRGAVQATVQVLAEADAATIEKATFLVAQLPDLVGCRDVDALTSTRLAPPAAAEEQAVAHARARLAEIRARMHAGHYARALTDAERVAADTAELAYAPLKAEVALVLAWALAAVGREKEADDAFHRAVAAAVEAKHHETAAWAWLGLASGRTNVDRYDDALRFVHLAQAETAAWGQDGGLVVEALERTGDIHDRAGRHAEALAVYERVVAVHDERGRKLDRADALARMGTFEMELRRLDDGERHLREALDLRREAFGPDHPAVARTHRELAMIFHARGDIKGALAEVEIAERLLRASLGRQHSEYVSTAAELGQLLSFAGEHDRAIELIRHADAVASTHGSDDIRAAFARAMLSQVLFNAQQFPEAARTGAEAVAAMERIHPEGSAREVVPRTLLGQALLQTGDAEGALAQAERGLALCKKLCPPRDPNLIGLYELKARVLTERGDRRALIDTVTEGLTLAEELGGVWEGWMGFRWAEAVWDDPKQRPRALERARRGQVLLQEAGDGRVWAIERWLADHDAG
jgi:eukaryotic-like serine/threonine-protein kinase